MMKYINNKILILVAVVCFASACKVDDYRDSVPARPMDAPAGFMGDFEFLETNTSGDTYIYVEADGSVTISIDIVRAPGMVDSVSYTLSNSIQPEDLGTVSNITFPQGQASGEVTLTYNGQGVEGEETMTITVWDAQTPRKGTTFTLPASFYIADDCFANRNVVGFYDAVSSGFDATNGVDYTNLEYVDFEIYLRGDNNPGYVRFVDGSFGLYAAQGYAGDFINVEICDGAILGASESEGPSDFTYSGTLNDDGSMNITWSNIYGDTGNTVLTPK